jgi:hypothetical protein
MKDWNEVLEFLARLGHDQRAGNSKENIQEIRIKKYEKNKWKVSITKERNAGVGLHDLFW